MSLKTTLIYSPNFNTKKRNKKQIKFLIFHYTGMKKEKDAIKKLTNIQSQVSTHYLIKKNGEILKMVPDLYVAWHAGISQWGLNKLLNKDSIGIEIANPGHKFKYSNFPNKQIKSLIKLSKYLPFHFLIFSLIFFVFRTFCYLFFYFLSFPPVLFWNC